MLGSQSEKRHSSVFLVLIGILKNESGAPEDEENFEEAIKNVNTALNTTQVSKELRRPICFLTFSYVKVDITVLPNIA